MLIVWACGTTRRSDGDAPPRFASPHVPPPAKVGAKTTTSWATFPRLVMVIFETANVPEVPGPAETAKPALGSGTRVPKKGLPGMTSWVRTGLVAVFDTVTRVLTIACTAFGAASVIRNAAIANPPIPTKALRTHLVICISPHAIRESPNCFPVTGCFPDGQQQKSCKLPFPRRMGRGSKTPAAGCQGPGRW